MQPELTEQVVEPESCLAAARRQAASCGSNQVVNSVDTFLANKFGQDEWRCWGFMMVTRQRVCAQGQKPLNVKLKCGTQCVYATSQRGPGNVTLPLTPQFRKVKTLSQSFGPHTALWVRFAIDKKLSQESKKKKKVITSATGRQQLVNDQICMPNNALHCSSGSRGADSGSNCGSET